MRGEVDSQVLNDDELATRYHDPALTAFEAYLGLCVHLAASMDWCWWLGCWSFGRRWGVYSCEVVGCADVPIMLCNCLALAVVPQGRTVAGQISRCCRWNLLYFAMSLLFESYRQRWLVE